MYLLCGDLEMRYRFIIADRLLRKMEERGERDGNRGEEVERARRARPPSLSGLLVHGRSPVGDKLRSVDLWIKKKRGDMWMAAAAEAGVSVVVVVIG